MWYLAILAFLGGSIFGVFLMCILMSRKEDKNDE